MPLDACHVRAPSDHAAGATLRRVRRVPAIALAIAAVLVGSGVAQAVPGTGVLAQTAPSDDETMFNGVSIVGPSPEEIAAAREAIDDIEDDIDRAEAELAVVEDELALVEQRLRIATDALTVAEEVAWQANQAADVARDDLTRVQRQLADARTAEADNQAELVGFARDAYMYGPSAADPMLMLLDGLGRNGSADLSRAQSAVDVVARDRTQVLEDTERLVATTAGLEAEAEMMEQARADKEAEAEAARDEAATQHAVVLDLLNQTEAKVQRQQELIDQLADERVEAVTTLDDLEEEAARAKAAAEAKRKAEEEARRKAEEARRRAEEAARRAAEEAAREAAEEAAREAARRAAEEAAQQAADEAAAEAARAEEAAAAARREAAEAEEEAAQAEQARADRQAADTVSVSVNGGLATVGGITVAASIAGQLEALLNAARADGIVLGGHGYRSPDTTARLRVVNGCPDIYTSPASSCRVPTAIPGSSMHEKGLAIDFTWQGQTICFPNPPSRCHGNAAFDWLQANAASYGLYGLSSEAWHYSTNGN